MHEALFTVEDLAAYLGVSRWTIYRLLKSREIQVTRVRGAFRFTPQAVEKYLAGATKARRGDGVSATK